MKIKFWGTRGSLAANCRHASKYGGATACVEIITSKGETLIADLGTSAYELGVQFTKEQRLNAEIIFTHFHLDHILGFPFFAPFYDEKCTFNISCAGYTAAETRRILTGCFTPPYFPVKVSELKAKLIFNDNHSPSFNIKSIQLNHPDGCWGYKIADGGKTFVFCTDNELTGPSDIKKYAAFALNADLLVHDAEYTKHELQERKGWGHSFYLDAVDLALEAKVKKLGLFHHSHTRTDAAIDAIIEECKAYAKTKNANLEVFACADANEINL